MIPLILAAIPSLITGVVKIAEIALPKKEGEPSRGPEKKSLAMDLVTSNFDVLERHGIMPNVLAENRAVVLSIASLAIDGAAVMLKKEPPKPAP